MEGEGGGDAEGEGTVLLVKLQISVRVCVIMSVCLSVPSFLRQILVCGADIFQACPGVRCYIETNYTFPGVDYCGRN